MIVVVKSRLSCADSGEIVRTSAVPQKSAYSSRRVRTSVKLSRAGEWDVSCGVVNDDIEQPASAWCTMHMLHFCCNLLVHGTQNCMHPPWRLCVTLETGFPIQVLAAALVGTSVLTGTAGHALWALASVIALVITPSVSFIQHYQYYHAPSEFHV